MKEQKKEPSYPRLVAASPKASWNPRTGEAVDKKVVYNILRKRCYDDPNDPEDTWTHDARRSTEALTPQAMEMRRQWSRQMLDLVLRGRRGHVTSGTRVGTQVGIPHEGTPATRKLCRYSGNALHRFGGYRHNFFLGGGLVRGMPTQVPVSDGPFAKNSGRYSSRSRTCHEKLVSVCCQRVVRS